MNAFKSFILLTPAYNREHQTFIPVLTISLGWFASFWPRFLGPFTKLEYWPGTQFWQPHHSSPSSPGLQNLCPGSHLGFILLFYFILFCFVLFWLLHPGGQVICPWHSFSVSPPPPQHHLLPNDPSWHGEKTQ